MLFWFQRAYLVNPLHLMGRVSACFTLGGGGVLAWITYEKIFLHVPMGSRPALILAVLSLLLGFLVLLLGFVAEMISSVSQVLANRKPYVIATPLDVENHRKEGRPARPGPTDTPARQAMHAPIRPRTGPREDPSA